MTKSNTNMENEHRCLLLTAIAFISSSALAGMNNISVFAAAPSNSSSSMTSISHTKTLDHMLVQNLTKTNVPVTLPLTRGYVPQFFYDCTLFSYR